MAARPDWMVGMPILIGLFFARETKGKTPTTAAAAAPDNTWRRLRRLSRLLDIDFLLARVREGAAALLLLLWARL